METHDTRREFEKEITLSSVSDASSNRLHGRTRILRASEVLLSLAGRALNGDAIAEEPGPDTFQEALRDFPPFRGDDGGVLGAVVDVRCPDCDAVFSSTYEPEPNNHLWWPVAELTVIQRRAGGPLLDQVLPRKCRGCLCDDPGSVCRTRELELELELDVD